MIDVNKIRSMKTLESMKKVCNDFIGFDRETMIEVYAEDYGWGVEDYEADLDSSITLLEQVERRMKSLGKHLTKGKKETDASQSDH